MKKCLALFLALAMVLTAVPVMAEGNVFSATAQGFGGPVEVVLTVEDGKVTDAVVTGSGETEVIGGAAMPKLAEAMKVNGSVDVDAVSGATVTSTAVLLAAKDAYAQATGTAAAEKAALTDGVYTASAPGYSWMGMITADVTVENGALKDFIVTEEHESYTGEVAQPAFDLLPGRILAAQSLAVDAISGATATSNAIKSVFAQAIALAGGNALDWYAPVEKKTETVTLEGYDVIVVGMGGSGINAFCAAADSGATVFGIETCAKLGGQSATTTGPMILGSQNGEFKDAAFPPMDEVYNTWIEYVGSEEKADIIRECVYNNGKYIDYYMDNFGFEFAGTILSFEIPTWTALWTRYKTETKNVLGPNKTFMFDRAVAKAVGMNEKNGFALELTADALLFDEAGNVKGVHAVSYDGTEYNVYGDSVILATGGYIGNDEMVNKYLQGTTPTVAFTVNKGDGINMGVSAGGATYMLAIDPMIHILQVPNMIKNNDLTPDQKAILSAFALVSGELKIDINGKVLDPAIKNDADIPGYHYYVVYTEEQMNGYKANGLTENFGAAGSHFLGQGGTIPIGTPVEDLDTILSVGAEYGNVFKAESIAELASVIGCDAAVLSETLNGAEGTYYAVCCMSYAYATVGGLDVDVNMNVLRADGTPIANLYAVGQDSEGVCNVEGKPYTPWGGQAQAWTYVSGYLAGKAAAAAFAG
ncbi:MAG: FMN-binding protein [Clostridia bacterium]|nr:FMN-binding protein [Clostridia bacterium]